MTPTATAQRTDAPRIDARELLHHAARLLGDSDDYRRTLEHTLLACLPALGDFGFFDTRDGEEVIRVSGAHDDEAVAAILKPTRWSPQLRTDMNLCALSSGLAALHADIDDAWYRAVATNEQHLAAMRGLAFRSMITVPMRFQGQLIGALTLFMAKSGRRHGSDHLGLAADIAAIAAPVVVNARLVEQHAKAEQALRASEERLRLSYRAAHVGAWDWIIASNEVYWSPEYREIYGLDPDATPTFERGMAPVVEEDRALVANAMSHALAERGEYRTTHRINHPVKGLRWIEGIGRPEYGPDGSPVRVAGISADVTDKRVAEELLRESDRRKDEFLAILAHELRNPLAPIRYAVSVLRQSSVSPQQRAGIESMIERQVAHMGRLLDDLLDVSRIARGKVQLRRARCDVASIVQAALEAVRPQIDARRHTLAVHLPATPVTLEADAVRLTQVVTNLLTNATKYTNAGGRITLDVSATADEVRFEVSDNGMGISAEMKPRLFQLFAQDKPAYDRSEGGLGVGLALAKAFVEMHGGRIAAASEGEGKGSRFTVQLPREASA